MGKGDIKTRRGKIFNGSYGKTRPRKGSKGGSMKSTGHKMQNSIISNRPRYLEENIKHYKAFPLGFDMDMDYKYFPPLLNLDLHTLNGIVPLTKSRFDYLGEDQKVIFTNPLPKEYEYYDSIGVSEFQAIQIVINCFVFKEESNNSLTGLPYSLSLVPMEKQGKIDTWNIDLLRGFDLERICQEGGYVYTGFNPFKGWVNGIVSHYSLFNKIETDEYPDCIGFVWGMYFLSPEFDKHEVQMMENSTFSKQINANYRKYKTDLYFKKFKDLKPRRIWGCDSPIELFLLQGLYLRNIKPEIQMCIYKNGEIFPNYYKMQESEIFVKQDKLITAADFYFPDKKLAVFCDGKEFHDNEKDKKIDDKLKELGIKTVRFTGKEISEKLEDVLDKIENELGE